jgi:hypothetical protein
MKDSDFNKLTEWLNVGGGLTPHNSNAIELLEQSARGEILMLKELTDRDIKFHRCYFSLLNFIYGYMPPGFKKKIKPEKFYQFLKHLRGEYDEVFTFSDGSKMIEYESIALGNMSQKRFESYIREQLPYIYANVLSKYFEGEMLTGIIDTIEEEYKKFLSKL